MQFNIVWAGAREAIVEVRDGGTFHTLAPWRLFVDGEDRGLTDTVETYIDGLCPGRKHVISACREDGTGRVETSVTCAEESALLNVRDFGASGDGEHDDTAAIQAAIMCCPPQGRVLVPEGRYRVTNLFLASETTLELAEGAVLSARTDRESFAWMPGTVKLSGGDLLPLGTWEGESVRMFAGILNGVNVHDVTVCGRGCLDGNASWDEDNWWHEAKRIRIAARPRMAFFSECSGIDMAGIVVRDSPSWNIHPVLCERVSFQCMRIESPKVSPNTDGINPESCSGVVIRGCEFSVGDDCIAIKSGKLSKDSTLRPACTGLLVEQCYMHDGHGAVVLGSESAGGIKGLTVRDCLFERTDRGLRVKTRRGRGAEAVTEDVLFEHIRMRDVLTPFVVNSFYNCDPDGMSDYVQCRTALPVDERTPKIGVLVFHDIVAERAHAAAAYLTGLPESKVERIELHDVRVTMAPDAVSAVPAMAGGVDAMSKQGFIAQHVASLVLDGVVVEGCEGKSLQTTDVDEIVRV